MRVFFSEKRYREGKVTKRLYREVCRSEQWKSAIADKAENKTKSAVAKEKKRKTKAKEKKALREDESEYNYKNAVAKKNQQNGKDDTEPSGILS